MAFQSKLRPTFTVMVCVVISGYFLSPLQAQYESQPQAQSPDEYDQYLELSERKSPQDFLALATAFEKAWPHSALLAVIDEQELEAYESVGDIAGAEKAGEEALRRIPDNLKVMVELAYLLANSHSEKAQLARAQVYARRVLELLASLQIPRRISPKDWADMRAALRKKAHTALGLVAFKQARLDEAEKEFVAASANGGQEDLSLQFRLGVVYRLMGHNAQAVDTLTHAATSNEPAIRQRALQELEKLNAQK